MLKPRTRSGSPPSHTAPAAADLGRISHERPPDAPEGQRVVAITGAASFLGVNLVGLLEEDRRTRRIVAIDVTAPETARAKTRSYAVDFTHATSESTLSEILSAERVDTLVHLAFLSSPARAAAWAHELESVGTMHILVAARHAAVRSLVMWSQTLLYGADSSNPNFLEEHHPLRASRTEGFFADKIAAEAEAERFAHRTPGAHVTILRTAPILGPTVQNYLTRYLSRRFVPTMMGFDPLVQFLHEIDAVAALKLAIDRAVPGTFNIVGDGVLPISTVIKLAGRIALPIPHPLAEAGMALGWATDLGHAPPTFSTYLRFLCVADGQKARTELGFVPAYTTREAVLDFANTQRLRELSLLQETSG